MNILFTVPHSICKNPERDCDTMALKAHKYLVQHFPHSSSVISNRYRSEMDLNRIESTNSSFHAQYIERLQSFDKNGLLVDIHSFPNDSSPDTYDLDFYIILENINEKMKNLFKLFDIIINHDNIDLEYNKIFKYKIFKGNNNFIIEEANRYGIDSFILEFNESLSDERLIFLCNTVATVINLYTQ